MKVVPAIHHDVLVFLLACLQIFDQWEIEKFFNYMKSVPYIGILEREMENEASEISLMWNQKFQNGSILQTSRYLVYLPNIWSPLLAMKMTYRIYTRITFWESILTVSCFPPDFASSKMKCLRLLFVPHLDLLFKIKLGGNEP